MVKRLTDLSQQLALLHRHGPAMGIDFQIIADHLNAYVAVKDQRFLYQYINLPGQAEGMGLSPTGDRAARAAQATELGQALMGSLVPQIQAEDQRALASATPLVQWSEPRLLADGSSERLPQVKIGLRNAQGEPQGVMDIAPLTGDDRPGAALQIRRMNQSLDLITDVLGLLMRSENETDLLERACSTMVVRGGYLAAAIVPIEGEPRMAGVPLCLAGDRAELALAGPFALDDPLWEQHPAARAAESGLCVVHHCTGCAETVAWQLLCPTDVAQALIALPLQHEDEVFAVMLLACAEPGSSASPHTQLLQRMADELSLGIELLRSKARLASERQQREIHLRQQRMASQRLSLATDAADVGIWELDLARGTVTLDERALAQHGLPPHSQVLPLGTMMDWIHPQDVAGVERAMDDVRLRGQAAEITLRSTPPDGRTRLLRAYMAPLRGEDNQKVTGVLGSVKDVTDHARSEQQLKDLDAKLRMVTEATGLGLWELDINAQNMLLDARTHAIYGLGDEPGSLSLSAWLGWVHPGQRQAVMDQLKDSQRRPSRQQIECAVTPPDGRLRRVLVSWASQANAHGEVVELVGTQVDVTERRRDQDRVAQTHQRLALLAGASGVGQWRYSLHEGFAFDEACYRMLGVVGKALPAPAWLMEMCLPSSQREALELAMITADDHLEVSLQWQGLDGASRQVVWMGSVDRDARRTITKGEGLCIDVTIQQQLNDARQQPPALQGLAQSATTLTARISQELRSPLNAILGFVQLMRQHPQPLPPDAKDDYLGEVEKAGRHLLDLVGDAMDLSRIESGDAQPELEDLSLVDLMGELLPLLEQQAMPLAVHIELGQLGAWPSVRADRRMLKQALMTVGARAIARSPRHGQVELHFERHGPDVALMVSDQGPALSEAEGARLFEPFDMRHHLAATDHNASALALPMSSGTRLAIARHGAQAMGGQLHAANRPGGGVTFLLSLPAAEPALPSPKGARAALSPAEPVLVDSSVTGRVLYLEDNPSNVMLVSECLSLRPGIELVIATTVQEALQIIRQERFDLALLDLQLPDGEGYAVLRPLRDQRGHRTHCIALTANAMLNERNRALEAGFDAFWTKPLDLPAFLRGIDQALLAQPH